MPKRRRLSQGEAPPPPARREEFPLPSWEKKKDHPFLVVAEQDHDNDENDDNNDTAAQQQQQVLQWMLAFVDYSKPSIVTDKDDDDTENNSRILVFQEAVRGLVQTLREAEEKEKEDEQYQLENDETVLQRDGGGGGGGGIKNEQDVDDYSSSSHEGRRKRLRQDGSDSIVANAQADDGGSGGYTLDIARLLFPWAVQQITKLLLLDGGHAVAASDDDKHFRALEYDCWQALRFSLSRLLQVSTQGGEERRVDDAAAAGSNNFAAPFLTQSMLFKLVPRLARLVVMSSSALTSSSSSSGDKVVGTSTTHSKEEAAEVYRVLLVNQLYRPTLDVAVETVLLPLVEAMKLQETYTSRRVLPTTVSSKRASMSMQRKHLLLYTTLRWLYTRMNRHGHPKTNFGVIALRAVLLALARIHLLWQALPEGRLLSEVDYAQDDQTMGRIMQPGGETADTTTTRQVLHQIIYHGLFAPQHHMDGFKSLSVSSSFTCYQNDLLETIATVLRDSTCSPNDVRDMAWFLPVLLKNAFQASRAWYQAQPDKQRKKAPPLSALQFALFQRMAEPLLETLEKGKVVNDSSITTVGLRSLREMHELLEEFQAYVPAHDPKGQPQLHFLQRVATLLLERPVDPSCFSGLEQFSDMIQLITRLMQLNHQLWQQKEPLWPRVLRLSLQSSDARIRGSVCAQWRVATEIFTQLRQIGDWIRILVAVAETVNNEDHSEVLADVLMESSVEQALALHVQSCPVNQIPEVFSAVQSALKCPNESNLSLVVRPLATTVLRSFKVDPTTVDTVSKSLQNLVTEALTDLVECQGTVVRKVCTEIFGWCIDLSMRCAFWKGPLAQLSIPESVHAAIIRSKDDDDGLLLVAAHRLRQLSSLLHDKQLSKARRELSPGEGIEALESEARRLTFHLYDRARTSSSGHGWVLIAQFLQFWTPFATQDQVDAFLGWMLAILSLDSSMDDNVPACFMIPAAGDLAKQKEVCRCLLHDEAFYDTAIVVERLSATAVKITAKWILLAISGIFGQGEAARTEGYLSNVDEIMGLEESSFITEWQAIDLIDGLSTFDRDSAERHLCCAMESMRVLNGIPWDCPQQALSLIYLDRLVCDAFLNRLDVRFYVTAISISSCIRRALTKGVFISDSNTAYAILKFLHETTSKCILADNSVGSDEAEEIFLMLTGNVTECVIKTSIADDSNGRSFLSKWFDRMLPTQGHADATARGNDGVLILHTFRGISESGHLQLREFAGRVIQRYFETFQTSASATWKNVIVCKVVAEALLYQKDPVEGFDFESIREILISVCLNWMYVGTTPEIYLPILLSLLSTEDTLTENLLDKILCQVAVLERGGSNIPPIVSACIGKVSDESFVEFLDFLVDPMQKGLCTRLDLIRLLFTESFLPEGRNEAFTENKERLLDFALYSMLETEKTNKNAAPIATEIWFQAVRAGHPVKKEKLSILVGRIAEVLGPGARSSSLYTACAKLLALLLQRYSNHLSTSAPVVILALQSLLRQLTDANLSNDDLSLRARYWTRLCELLVSQKEVYKKHAVHLVLESLRGADDANLRHALMPGWMHLLDAFSPVYELKQLNSLMEEQSTKLKFRPIYELYRHHQSNQGR